MASGASTACRPGRRASAALAIAAAAALPACAAAPAQADARAEISGRVIDAATGAPVAGAVVIATWWTELAPNPAAIALGLAFGGHGEAERRTAYMSEAITDRDGRFSIPAWSAARQWHAGNLTSYSPLIRFVARGYSPAAIPAGRWTTGLTDDLAPGLRGARQMALYRPGQTPKPNLGRNVSGLAVPSLEEERFNELQKLQGNLEADAAGADAPNAPADSAARERAKGAQRQARQLVGEELRAAYAVYSKEKR